MFSLHYRSRHEPLAAQMIDLLQEETLLSRRPAFYDRYFKARDNLLYLELEASHLLGPFVGILHQSFPSAKFILPVRDAYSWLDSILNDELNLRDHATHSLWIQAYQYYFQPDRKASTADKPLVDRGLAPLDGYLSYWVNHHLRILEQITPSRLLILKTSEIQHSAQQLANFLDIPPDTINLSQSHVYTAPCKHHVLRELDPCYLKERMDHYCAALMTRLYPELADNPDLSHRFPLK